MFNKPLQQKYGRPRKLNYRYTSIPSVFSLAKKVELILKHRNCGHIKGRSWRSIQFGDNHVVCATKVIFNCIIQPINSWKKITRKFTFIGLAVQGTTLRQILSRHNNKNIFKGTAKKTKTNYLWIVLNYAMWNRLIFYHWYLIPYSVSVSVSVSMIPFPFPDSRFPIPDSRFPILILVPSC